MNDLFSIDTTFCSLLVIRAYQAFHIFSKKTFLSTGVATNCPPNILKQTPLWLRVRKRLWKGASDSYNYTRSASQHLLQIKTEQERDATLTR
ncbi:hypothetical protein VNO77_08106 [Canavalia gladiata]|uniref:Uncharacterized protein n=1 Tax=Canavalia gladiata TaxID=3824 RepID=A0AAN9M9R5_CANGL